MADFPISSLPSKTLTSDTLLLGSMPDGLGGYDSGKFDAQAISGIVVKHMTQTDYDNLSPAEKNNGTLYITDGTLPSETVTGSDVLYFSDVSDSNKPKSTTAAAVATLFPRDADDVPYSSGVSVADKLDSLSTNIIDSNYVDLSFYSSSENAYTFPKDGYLYIENNDQYQGRAMLNGLIRIGTFSNVQNSTSGTATYVRKGMTVYTVNTCYIIRFYPLVY